MLPSLAHVVAVENAVRVGFQHGMFQHSREISQFLRWFATQLPVDSKIDTVIEIGAHRGGTAAMFCELGATRVISVDLPEGLWGGVGVVSARERDQILRSAYDAYCPVWADSHNAATFETVKGLVGKQRVDLLFIDGDHSYEGVKQDFEL
jgi:hypothetical protein